MISRAGARHWQVALGTAGALAVLFVAAQPPGARAASPTEVTLVVQKGGDRTGSQVVAGLAGVEFDFIAGTADVVPDGGAPVAASCTTDANGTCSVDVPGRSTGNEGYWIREQAAPAGWTAPVSLDVGAGSATTPTTYHLLFTGPAPNNTTLTFPVASDSNDFTARGDRWADIRDNPDLPDQCGLNIALLIDTSGSITPFLGDVKAAANGFVDALTGTPSQIAVYRFAQTASNVLGATAVPDTTSADVVKAAINGLTSGGTTNWDAGLFQIAASTTEYDAVLMLTDGNPTVYGPTGVGSGGDTTFRDVENGIFSANAVKAEGTKVVAVGVGDGVTGATDNLKAISGPVSGVDYVQTDYDELAETFREIALRTCSGTVSVVKKVIPPMGQPADGVPTGGWTFTASAGVTPGSGVTADGSGAVSFTADLSQQATVPVTLTETLQTGYLPVQNAGSNATCLANGSPVASVNVGLTGFTVNAARNTIVGCTVYNQAPDPMASVVVNKTWVINGTVYPDPTQPVEFEADLTLTGQDDPQWGHTYGGYTTGDNVTVGEVIDTDLLPPGCTNEATGDLGAHTLVAGLNTFAVTNTVTCVTRLTLRKEVVNPYGTAEPVGSWTLSAYPPGSDTPLLHGVSGISGVVQAGTRYSMGETTVAGYQQEVAAGAVITPPATGSWHCQERTRTGRVGQEFNGQDGTVTVQLGQNTECTATNTAQPAKLTLRKSVTNPFGGTAQPADWTLQAVPPLGSGAIAITGHDGEAGVTGAEQIPGVAYALSEVDGPEGYAPDGSASCVLTGTDTAVPTPDGVLVAAVGQDITCTFANRELAPSPTPTASASPTGKPRPPLPVTGTPIAAIAAGGVLAIAIGAGMLIGVRRRS